MKRVHVPEVSLVLLVGVSGSGKSSFARKHFLPTEVVSSDFCRGLVSDDENNQSATNAAFDLLHYIAAKRLQAGKLTVVDATNVQAEGRKPLIELAKKHHSLAVAVVLNVAEEVCAERNATRPDRDFGPHVLRNQRSQLRRSMKSLRREGFHRVIVLEGVEEIDNAEIVRDRLWNDRRDDHGPFDIIGDVHGCYDELVALLGQLGYEVAPDGTDASHPDGRRVFFVGDLVDRGPKTPEVLRLAMGMVGAGHALCVPGNHENKLLRAMNGRNVTVSHGLAESLAQLAEETDDFRASVAKFIDGLVSHLVLDDGKLVVAHAGLRADMHGRASGAVRSFALYGDTTGETDDYGLPVRYPWANDYRGDAMVVYGHTPVPEAEWVNRTICIDTGCVFGGKLTALRYPERELVSVPAAKVYWEPTRPLVEEAQRDETRAGTDLDLDDVLGKRIITTRRGRSVTIREENAIAALEVMSRFAADPRWLVYLPPTMAPTATTQLPGLLEHPLEAFASFRSDGVTNVVCEEKHMGSRAVVVVCRDEEAARRRFGVDDSASMGAIVTRTGRAFFNDDAWERNVLDRTRSAITAAGLWEELESDWFVLDAELMPWSAKAEDLIRRQYASVGASAGAAMRAEASVLAAVGARGIDVGQLHDRAVVRASMADRFTAAYRQYCWKVDTPEDLKLAPFQILAREGNVDALTNHLWHLEQIGRLVEAEPGLMHPTATVTVDLSDDAATDAAVTWWESLTAGGGEGMVVKPVDVLHPDPAKPTQPGIKCRGPEYLRIIYGPEYTLPENLDRLRSRGLGHKRSLALREFALGIEALQRFVEGEPLYRVHECVFGVLALESEPVDPRL